MTVAANVRFPPIAAVGGMSTFGPKQTLRCSVPADAVRCGRTKKLSLSKCSEPARRCKKVAVVSFDQTSRMGVWVDVLRSR